MRLLIVDGHKDSADLLIDPFLGVSCTAAPVSRTGVDGEGLRGDDGVEGRLLSAEIALFGNCTAEVDDALMALGETLRFGAAAVATDRVGDIYLELTSLVLDLRVAPFLLSAETRGGLKFTAEDCLPNAFSNSHASIQIEQR